MCVIFSAIGDLKVRCRIRDCEKENEQIQARTESNRKRSMNWLKMISNVQSNYRDQASIERESHSEIPKRVKFGVFFFPVYVCARIESN